MAVLRKIAREPSTTLGAGRGHSCPQGMHGAPSACHASKFSKDRRKRTRVLRLWFVSSRKPRCLLPWTGLDVQHRVETYSPRVLVLTVFPGTERGPQVHIALGAENVVAGGSKRTGRLMWHGRLICAGVLGRLFLPDVYAMNQHCPGPFSTSFRLCSVAPQDSAE